MRSRNDDLGRSPDLFAATVPREGDADLVTMSLSERQLRIITAVGAIDDEALLDRVQRMIDLHRSGLRVLDEREMRDILDDLRLEGDD